MLTVTAGPHPIMPRFLRATVAVVAVQLLVVAGHAGPSLGLPAEIIEETSSPGAFPLVAPGRVAPLWYDTGDHVGVLRAIGDLQADIESATGHRPTASPMRPGAPDLVIVGTLGRNATIDALVASGKLSATDLRGKRESFVITSVDAPLPGVKRALVITGSDKRGTIYGIYELSEQLGVSPWHWWADVPPKSLREAHVLPGYFASGEPAVRYRGIFLNDEAPCLTGWAREKFGGLNSKFYVRVFELLLRLRANYLWPAMWDNAFSEDDPANPRLADEYGIVMGTSHHEPMMRARQEWTVRSAQYGNGQWNYSTNADALQRFFREGIARNKPYENLVTIGLRGDGDEAMTTTGSVDSDIRLLERIFADQRGILAEELQSDPAKIPQLWALFTEVQKFYEQGLRPPDDVTLLWTDDNTGNLRRLPTDDERKRSGGSGIYYHFDMHGGPFSYQWINTNPLPKIAEQMNLAYAYGADRVWIVNVGDLKPLELPIEFFLRMAWNPAALTKDKIADYTRRWAARDFGPAHAEEIAGLVARYAKYNGWRKPELLAPETFSLVNYDEAEGVEATWRELAERAESLYALLPAAQRDAFYQLVLYPVKASAVVAQMNIAAGRNHLFARQGRASTNAEAERVRALFRQDQALSDYYNHQLAGGKWNHLMDQAHLGEFSWEPPRVNAMPAVAEVLPAPHDHFGVAIEGDINAWPGHFGAAALPVFDSFNPRRSYLEIFAEGTQPIEYAVSAGQPWIVLTKDPAPRSDQRYWVEIDWPNAPVGFSTGTVTVVGQHEQVSVQVPLRKATEEQALAVRGRFASLEGPVAMGASAATRNSAVGGVGWAEVPDYGRVAAGMAIYPVTASSVLPPNPAPTLEYPLYLPRSGTFEVTLVLGPVMDFVPDRGMRIGVALDDEAPQVLDIFADRAAEGFLGENWSVHVARDNARFLRSSHKVSMAGPHVLKISMVDPGIVLQKIIVHDRRLPESYFGPLESSLVK